MEEKVKVRELRAEGKEALEDRVALLEKKVEELEKAKEPKE